MTRRLDLWWKTDEGEEYASIYAVIRAIDERQGGVRDSLKDHLGLYLDREVADFTSAVKARNTSLFGRSRRLNLNVVRSCIDTVKSKIVAHRPRPMFTTIAGRFGDRQKAKKLERWVDGLFYREKMYAQHAPQVFLDACIDGTGCIKVFEEENEVKLEWVWNGEIMIDELSSLYSPPRVMFQRKFLSRDVLLEMFPDKQEEIDSLDDQAGHDMTMEYMVDDIVEVIEAWHLPSGPGAKDGKRVIAISTATLLAEEYTKDDFPFVFFRWSRNPLGFYGIGLAEELQGIQIEIKHLLERIQESMQLTATAWILKPRGTKLPDEHISNRVGAILEYDGMIPPKVETPASMNSQVFEHVWRLYDKAYEISGISQLSASGTKPAGIESGIALRTLVDVETQRFAMVARDWEEFHLSVARKAVDLARDVYKGKNGKVKWADRNLVEEIKWSDVNLDEDAYVLQMYPVNLLPNTPAGKLATTQELIQMNMLTPEEAKSLLDFPDLDKVQDLSTADYEDLQQIMEGILYENDFVIPRPEMNLQLGVRLANHYWVMGRKEGAPQQSLDLLTRWMQEAQVILAPPQLQPTMPGGMPPGPEAGLPPEMGGGAPPMPPEMMPSELSMASPGDAAAGVMAPPPPPVVL